MADPRALGEAILRGARPPYQLRAERLQKLYAHLFGATGPVPDGSATPPHTSVPPLARGLVAQRRAIERAAGDAVEALLTGKLDRLGQALAPEVWMPWPDGPLLRHPQGPLLAALGARFVKAAPVLGIDPRVYAPAELYAGVAHGVIEGYDAILGLDRSAIVTLKLDSPRIPLGRALVTLELHADRWRLTSLPMVAPDEAWVAGKSASTAEDDALRVADKAIRHHLLGHDAQLRALRNQCLPKIWIDDELIVTEDWPDRAIKLDPDRAFDIVFLGVRSAKSEKLGDRLGPQRARAVEQQAKGAWQRPLAYFRPRLVLADVGRYDPDKRQVVDLETIPLLLAREIDVDVRKVEQERWRLAGLWPSAAKASGSAQ